MLGTFFGQIKGLRSQSRRLRKRPRLEPLETRDVPHSLALTPLVAVSGTSPFFGNSIEASDPPATLNSEVEPCVAVDPTNPNHLVGAWTQDFARGIVAAVSLNGGNSWQSCVVPGITQLAGGIYPHTSNTWVSFSPNGVVYLSTVGHDFPEAGNPNAVLVSKSMDGGLTWGNPTTVSTGDMNVEKPSITADSTDSHFAYASWFEFKNNANLAMFARTSDGGRTWEPAREIFNPGSSNVPLGHQVVVLPNGTLVSFFTQRITTNHAGGVFHQDLKLSSILSADHGQTWLPANSFIQVADIIPPNDMQTVPGIRGISNPDSGIGIDTPFEFFDVAVDPNSGNLYTVWQDVRFSNAQYAGIAFSMSIDGGYTWSVPIKINQTPENIPASNRQAFQASVSVNQDGVVAVTYFDFRNNTPAPGLLTDYWMVHAHPTNGLTNPASWSSENRITPTSFNIENAPLRDGYYMGDYQSLVAQGQNFGAFFATTQGEGSTSIFYRDPLPVETSGASNHNSHSPTDFTSFRTCVNFGQALLAIDEDRQTKSNDFAEIRRRIGTTLVP